MSKCGFNEVIVIATRRYELVVVHDLLLLV